MGYVRQKALPAAEPVTYAMVAEFLRLPALSPPLDLALIGSLITAAREKGEILTGRCLAQRDFIQVLDAHPYYVDTVQSQLAYPPNYYSQPLYSTTLWNYSQLIKLGYPPCIKVNGMRCVATDGTIHTLQQDVDFVLDRITEPARIFPPPGGHWPADLYVANSVEIDYTAGYDPDPSVVDKHEVTADPPSQQPDSTIVSGVPQGIILGILNLVAYWYNYRGETGRTPDNIERIFLDQAILDFSPTRG